MSLLHPTGNNSRAIWDRRRKHAGVGRTAWAADLSVIGIQMLCHAMSFSQLDEVECVHNKQQRPQNIPAAHRTAGGDSDRRAPWRTYCVRPTRCDRNHRCALPSTPKVCCRRCSRMSDQWCLKLPLSWEKLMHPIHLDKARSTACKSHDMTWSTAVSVKRPDWKPDCNVGRRSADDK